MFCSVVFLMRCSPEYLWATGGWLSPRGPACSRALVNRRPSPQAS